MRARIGRAIAAAAGLALVLLGPASARTHAPAKYGGSIVVGVNAGEPSSLDSTAVLNVSALAILPAMCQRLYDRDARFRLVPVLAAALPVLSKDKLSYSVQLRKGVQFNDGTPFNAQAVVTTVQRYMTYPGSSKVSDYASVDSVTASGQYTVVFHLKGPDSTFTASNPGDFMLSPTQLAKLGADFASNPVCVGPFMFDHRVVGDNVTLIKSPYYYERGDVYLDKIVYKFMPDAAAAAAALKAGDIQVLSQVSPTDLAAVKQTSGLRVIQSPSLGWQGIFINIGNRGGTGTLPYSSVGTPLASSAKLRQAFEEAIDRNTLNRVVFDDLQQASCTPIVPANTAWHDATNVPCTAYNPTDAKKLVAASGFPNPTVHLMSSNATDRLRLAQFIQAEEAAVGINVVIDSTDGATSLARAAAGNFDAYSAGFGPGDSDPSVMILPFLATSGSRNYSGYSSPRLDLILSNGLKATSTRARKTLYHAAQQIISSDRPIIYLYNPVTVAAFSTTLTEVRLTYNGALDIVNAHYK